MMTIPDQSEPTRLASWIHPLIAGIVASVVGYASSFSIVLQGLTAVGASPVQAASGLFALCLGQGLLAIYLSLRYKQPISIAWSTPGAALLMGNGMPHGGFGVAVLAFIMTGLLIVIAGLWNPLRTAIARIPLSLSSAMLAGILAQLCMAPIHAIAQIPTRVLPIIISWLLAWLFIRRYAVLVALVATVLVIMLSAALPSNAFENMPLVPHLSWIPPVYDWVDALGIAIPLFIVTMASQNVPGIAVMKANGYAIPVRSAFSLTGLVSVILAPVGGHGINLSAITASLCAGSEAGTNPQRRYLASLTGGIVYLLLGGIAGYATTFVYLTPPLLIQSLAGLALLSTLGNALTLALKNDRHHLPAIITFLATFSGITLLGIGSAFWGVVAGGILLTSEKTVSLTKQM
ncbi:Inner membrane protein YdcO [Halomonadaceae bacterium LMG 33818]|uniref:benzoate/H(+) symporter BenE family transporter n=1 Tax=Cernens ardua TaxID=3402176 RepID=UPI003EDCA1FA